MSFEIHDRPGRWTLAPGLLIPPVPTLAKQTSYCLPSAGAMPGLARGRTHEGEYNDLSTLTAHRSPRSIKRSGVYMNRSTATAQTPASQSDGVAMDRINGRKRYHTLATTLVRFNVTHRDRRRERAGERAVFRIPILILMTLTLTACGGGGGGGGTGPVSQTLAFTQAGPVAGGQDSQVTFPATAAGLAFYRSCAPDCELANYASCAAGQMDFLTTATVTDTAVTFSQSGYYALGHGDNVASLTVNASTFPGRSGHQVVLFNNQFWSIGGYRGGDGTNDVWFSSDGVTWTQQTTAADSPARFARQVVAF
jgi:hypothetical protein